jgi:phage gpG-like protein
MVDGVRDTDRTDEVIDAVDEGIEGYIEQVFEQALDRIVSNMEAGQDAMGRSWVPLDPKTVAAKGHSTPLIDTGSLKEDIESSSKAIQNPPAAVFSSSLPYAGVHEFGWPERNIPARPFLQPGLEYAAEITDEVWAAEVDARIQSELL